MSSVLDGLRGVVHPDILTRTEEISRMLTALGVPHALIGGLAVGVHGYPRLTKDVDFLVGSRFAARIKRTSRRSSVTMRRGSQT